MVESELRFVHAPWADYARPPAEKIIDLVTGIQKTFGKTGYNPVLEAEIFHKPERIIGYNLVLTFQRPKADKETFLNNLLPSGQIIFTPVGAEVDGRQTKLPAAVFGDILPNGPFNKAVVLIHNHAYIYSPELALLVKRGLGFPILRNGKFERALNPNVWTEIDERVVAQVSCTDSYLRLKLLRGSVELVVGGRVKNQELIIQESRIPFGENIGDDLLFHLVRSPQDITRLHQLLTQDYPFRNQIRLATEEEEEAILSLF